MHIYERQNFASRTMLWKRILSKNANLIYNVFDNCTYIIDLGTSRTYKQDSSNTTRRLCSRLFDDPAAPLIGCTFSGNCLQLAVEGGTFKFVLTDCDEILKSLLVLLEEMCLRQEMLIDELKRKDLEIEDYRQQQGIQLHRKYLQTKPFDEDSFCTLTRVSKLEVRSLEKLMRSFEVNVKSLEKSNEESQGRCAKIKGDCNRPSQSGRGQARYLALAKGVETSEGELAATDQRSRREKMKALMEQGAGSKSTVKSPSKKRKL